MELWTAVFKKTLHLVNILSFNHFSQFYTLVKENNILRSGHISSKRDLSIYLFIYLSFHPSTHPFIHPSIHHHNFWQLHNILLCRP